MYAYAIMYHLHIDTQLLAPSSEYEYKLLWYY